MKTFRNTAALLTLMVIAAVLEAQPGIYPYCPQPYPRYPGYGVSSSNYYGGQPPYLMGGPAYGYTYPYPWQYSPYPPGPQVYGYPPYYAYMQPPVNHQSMYYQPRYAQPGTTMKSNSYSSPAAKDIKPTAKGTPLPGKELPPPASTTAKQPATPPPPAAAAKKSLFRRMLFW